MIEKNVEDMTIEEYEQYREQHERVCQLCGCYFISHSEKRNWCYSCSARRYKEKKARAQQ